MAPFRPSAAQPFLSQENERKKKEEEEEEEEEEAVTVTDSPPSFPSFFFDQEMLVTYISSVACSPLCVLFEIPFQIYFKEGRQIYLFSNWIHMYGYEKTQNICIFC